MNERRKGMRSLSRKQQQGKTPILPPKPKNQTSTNDDIRHPLSINNTDIRVDANISGKSSTSPSIVNRMNCDITEPSTIHTSPKFLNKKTNSNIQKQQVISSPIVSRAYTGGPTAAAAGAVVAHGVGASSSAGVNDGFFRPGADNTAAGTAVPSAPFESFDIEDATTMSGGTSWTHRIPWLRNQPRSPTLTDDMSGCHDTAAMGGDSCRSLPTTTDIADGMAYYGGIMASYSNGDVGNNDPKQAADQPRRSFRASPLAKVPQLPFSPRNKQKQRQQQEQKYRQPSPQQKTRQITHQQQLQHRNNQHENYQEQQSHHQHRQQQIQLPQQQIQQQQQQPLHQELDRQRMHDLKDDSFFQKPSSINQIPNSNPYQEQMEMSPENGTCVGKSFDSQDSLADFETSEWTPQDSAYGAAIPICGWVPKKLRQGIEATLIGLSVVILVYLVVTTSITVSDATSSISSNGNHSGGSNSGSSNKYDNTGLELDDDRYIEYPHYDDDIYISKYSYYMADDEYGAGNDDGY